MLRLMMLRDLGCLGGWMRTGLRTVSEMRRGFRGRPGAGHECAIHDHRLGPAAASQRNERYDAPHHRVHLLMILPVARNRKMKTG
jgi:hypothetical protein